MGGYQERDAAGLRRARGYRDAAQVEMASGAGYRFAGGQGADAGAGKALECIKPI